MHSTAQAAEVPTREELVDRARSLRELVEGNAAEAEEKRRLPQENIDAMREAGLLKITVPRRYGGYEVPVGTKIAVSEAMGENGCGSTTWVMTLLNVCNWMASLLPEQGQDDIWGENPDAAVAGVLNPTSEVTKVDGGYEVSGRWPFASGSLHSDWVLIGMEVPNAEGEVVDQALAFTPNSEITIEDTWFVTGMKGTGSNTIVADRIFIPEHRIFSVPKAIQNEYSTPFADEVAYRQSFIPVLTLILGGPQLGFGRAVLDFVVSKASKRGITYTKYETQADATPFQLEIAKAATLLDTARLHLYRSASDIEAAAAAGEPMDYVNRARVRADTGYGIRRVREAIDILMTAHGAGSFADVSPLQRIWRDSNTAGRHAVVAPVINDEVYGKALLGVPYEENITPLI